MSAIKDRSASPDAIDDLTGMFEPDEAKPGRHNVRFVNYPYHIWTIVGALRHFNGDVAVVAANWSMTEDDVRAAQRYEHRHQALFDAYFLLEEEEDRALDARSVAAR